MTRKKFVTRYSAFVQFTMKLAHEAKRCGIESLEQEVEDIEETEKVFKEGLRIILATDDPAAIVNEILSNMIAHEKNKYMRLYMTIQKRAVLGLLAGESAYILYKVLSSLAGLTLKERWKLDAQLLSGDEPEPEPDTTDDDNPANESDPFNAKILSLDDSAIKNIMREFESNVLAHALSPSTKTVRRKFYNNLSRRAAAMLGEDIEYMEFGGRSEDAQQMILSFIQNDCVPSNNAPRGFDNVGKYKWSDGTVYEGDFVGNKFHGKGKMTFADGGVYEGDYVDNKKTGKGKFTRADGTVYEGDLVDGQPNGTGKFSYTDGTSDEGDFVEGKLHGKGKRKFTNGIYEGEFVDDEPHGKGKVTYTDGRIYIGDYVNGERTGKGKMTYPDGKVEEGRWENGEYKGRLGIKNEE